MLHVLHREMTIVLQAIATPSLERSTGCNRKQIVYRKFVKQNISSQGRNSLGAFGFGKKNECEGKYPLRRKKPIFDGFSVFFEKAGRKAVFEKMMEDILVLDAAYGEDRQFFSMGGYLLYFPTEGDYTSVLATLAETYYFAPWIYEFDDSIWEDDSAGVVWRRRNYQLSSDDALAMYYPETVKGSERR